MPINNQVIDFIKDYIKDILGEKGYEYYIDEIGLIITPSTISVLVYTSTVQLLKNYLEKHGLNITKTNNLKKHVLYTMHYNDMLIVEVTDDEQTFNKIREIGLARESVSLKSIVKDLMKKGHTSVSINEILLAMAKVK